MQNFIFALEIKINRAVGNSGFLGDVGDLRVKVTFSGKNLDRCSQNRFAFIGDKCACFSVCACRTRHIYFGFAILDF